MIQHSLFPKITLPTRFSKYSCSLLDNIFCKLSNQIKTSTSGILLSDVSDHLLCFAGIRFISKKDKIHPSKVKQKINAKKATEAFIQDINSQNIHEKVVHDLYQDPNQNYRILSTIIKECKKKYFPPKNSKT